MKTRGFEVCKQALENKFKAGLLTREQLNGMIKKLRKNYQTGVAREQMDLSGIKNYMEY